MRSGVNYCFYSRRKYQINDRMMSRKNGYDDRGGDSKFRSDSAKSKVEDRTKYEE
jgi:hypothetical protein